MAENSKIEWTDHTFNPLRGRLRIAPQFSLMCEPVASLAKGNAVPNIETQRRKFGKRADMVGVEVATPIVATVSASKAVAAINIISPAFQFGRRSLAAPLYSFAIDIARSVHAAHRSLASSRADVGAGPRH